MSPTARSPGRSGRAGTAPRPPGSSARQASGSKTWPSCSPTTTCKHSSSPRPPATRSKQTSSTAPARRFLALAGERALGLDTAQAETRLARALELCPADDPERPELLLRWADAAFQAGRPREAAGRARRGARPLPRPRRERGRSTGADPARPRRATTGREPPPVALAARGSGAPRAGAARPDPRRCLHAARRGALPHGRTWRGDRSRRPCVRARRDARPARAGASRSASAATPVPTSATRTDSPRWNEALSHAHRAGRRQRSRHSPEQPRHRPLPAPGARPFARRLRAGDRLLRAARPRHAGGDDGGRLPRLARRARPPGGGARASRCARSCRSRRAAQHGCLLWLRALELATHLARGEADGASGIADWLVDAARTQATSDATVEVLAAVAAARLAAGAPDQARALLAEIEQTPGARDVPYYSRQLGAMLRTALAAGDPDLARAARRRARTTLSRP